MTQVWCRLLIQVFIQRLTHGLTKVQGQSMTQVWNHVLTQNLGHVLTVVSSTQLLDQVLTHDFDGAFDSKLQLKLSRLQVFKTWLNSRLRFLSWFDSYVMSKCDSSLKLIVNSNFKPCFDYRFDPVMTQVLNQDQLNFAVKTSTQSFKRDLTFDSIIDSS